MLNVYKPLEGKPEKKHQTILYVYRYPKPSYGRLYNIH